MAQSQEWSGVWHEEEEKKKEKEEEEEEEEGRASVPLDNVSTKISHLHSFLLIWESWDGVPALKDLSGSVLAWEVLSWAARGLELLPPALTRQELLPIRASHGISLPEPSSLAGLC